MLYSMITNIFIEFFINGKFQAIENYFLLYNQSIDPVVVMIKLFFGVKKETSVHAWTLLKFQLPGKLNTYCIHDLLEVIT